MQRSRPDRTSNPPSPGEDRGPADETKRHPQKAPPAEQPHEEHLQGREQKNEGEGNRTAAREYNRGAREFAESGRVPEQAKKAAEATDSAEGEELREAEKEGLRPARH